MDSQYSVTTPAGCESTKEAPGTGHRSTSHSSEGGWGEEEGIREKEKKKKDIYCSLDFTAHLAPI